MSASHIHRPRLVATLGLPVIILIGLPPFATPSPAPSASNLSNHRPRTFAAGEELTYAVYYMGFNAARLPWKSGTEAPMTAVESTSC